MENRKIAHVYRESGTYIVTVTARDSEGNDRENASIGVTVDP